MYGYFIGLREHGSPWPDGVSSVIASTTGT
jgi:hypothetical protein